MNTYKYRSTYKYRNLPCTDLVWCIFGHDNLNKMSGVLEWCYDRSDAENRLAQMKQFSQFEDLTAEVWEEQE